MTPNEFLESKGYGTEGYVTKSRKIICELLKEYEQRERDEVYIQGYNDAITDAAVAAEIKITYNSNSKFGEMPEIASCEFDLQSILKLIR